jgi:hypothetical protein
VLAIHLVISRNWLAFNSGYASTVTNNLDNELLTPLCALLNSANCSGVMFAGSILQP